MLNIRTDKWSAHNMQYIHVCKYMYNLLLLVMFILKSFNVRYSAC